MIDKLFDIKYSIVKIVNEDEICCVWVIVIMKVLVDVNGDI